LPKRSRIAFAPASIDSSLETFGERCRRGAGRSELGSGSGQLGLVHIGQCQRCSGRCQFESDRAPNALRRARNQCNSSLQIRHLFLDL